MKIHDVTNAIVTDPTVLGWEIEDRREELCRKVFEWAVRHGDPILENPRGALEKEGEAAMLRAWRDVVVYYLDMVSAVAEDIAWDFRSSVREVRRTAKVARRYVVDVVAEALEDLGGDAEVA